ncbi:50S ribosomal protein L11 methyltransferase [bacterium]|nr:50S ribosomal protein L11 methyltransferase [bacterium]
MKQPTVWPFLDIDATGPKRDLWLNVCWENGALGVQEDVPAVGYVRVFFPDKISTVSTVRALKLSFEALDDLCVTSGQLADPGWRTAWHDYFKSAPVGRRFIIMPSWESSPKTERIPLFIHPGQAFGTGQHESTHLSPRLMENLDLLNCHIFDAGCGSGVLGIAAVKLGAASVLGRDMEEEAVEEAGHNSLLNGTDEQCKWICSDVLSETEQFDCVLANLNIGFLSRFYHELVNCTNPGGKLVVSGFLLKDLDLVDGLFTDNGRCCIVEWDKMGEWGALSMVRNQ